MPLLPSHSRTKKTVLELLRDLLEVIHSWFYVANHDSHSGLLSQEFLTSPSVLLICTDNFRAVASGRLCLAGPVSFEGQRSLRSSVSPLLPQAGCGMAEHRHSPEEDEPA